MHSPLQGAIDTHVHSYPDVIPRKLDDIDLVGAARAAGMRGLVLKCHEGSTSERAYLLHRIFPDFCVFGGIVLNDTVGGFNARAVEAALSMGGQVIWMPTKSAANHQRHLGGSNGYTALNGQTLRAEVADIVKLAAEADAILCTGHLAPHESHVLIHEALAAGVKRISVTHPEWGVTAMPVEAQREFAGSGRVFFERCLVSVQPDVPKHVTFEVIVEQIRAVGIDTTVLATDYGMPQYSAAPDGMRDYIARLLAAKFTEEEVQRMARENPARLLRLEGGKQ